MAIMYKKFEPCDYILLIKNGKVIKEGQGLTVLCDNMRTNILAVPATAVDTAFAFDDLVTEDFQNVCVQGAITYIIKDYKRVIRMADFGYTRVIREKQMQGLAILNKRINNVVQAIVIRETGLRKVRDIIKQADEMATLIGDGLKNDEVIENLGIEILAVNVLGIQAKAETRKALEAVAREEILKQQDDAIYKRRNAAIEQERIIKENELNTEIKVAEKEREKGEKKIETKIMLEERNKELVALETENEKLKADEEAYRMAQMLKAFENVNIALVEALALAKMDPGTLMAKAFMEMGENAGKIGTLNITPDLLETIAGRTDV